MSGQAAVQKRIGKLTKQWLEFCDMPDARVLRWVLATDSARLLDTFLAFHGEAESDVQDLFFPISIPVSDPDNYWSEVEEEILGQIEDSKQDLEELEIDTDWNAPDRDRYTTSFAHLVDALSSYQAYYEDLFDHAVIVLLPSAIQTIEQWREAVEEIVEHKAIPESVRFIVPDWLPGAIFADLAIQRASLITTRRPVLDMPGLPLEILSHLPISGPGSEFRLLFTQLAAAATAGNMVALAAYAERALAIAVSNQWHGLVASVYLLVGSARAATADSNEVLETYRKAKRTAEQIQDPSRLKVLTVATLAEAGCQVENGHYREARQTYLEAARTADQNADALQSMDAHRLASYCAECNGDFEAAWHDAQEALRFAKDIPAESRQSSTLPALLHRMQVMSGTPNLRNQSWNFERECQDLLGGNWNSILTNTASLLS